MQYYAVIDTNVLVSAMLKRDSVPGSILEFAFSGVIIPVFNADIISEYINVLSRPKFHLTNDIVEAVVDEIKRVGVNVDPEAIEIDLPDPKDRVFYEVTMMERKDEDAYLITGNIKHFPLVSYVVSPREMLDIISGAYEI